MAANQHVITTERFPSTKGLAEWFILPRFMLRVAACVFRACLRVAFDWRRYDVGAFLAALLEELGPTFIKIGQILSCRPDLLPESVIQALRRLQDRVIPIDYRLIPQIIEESLGRPPDELFACFDPIPISSASVAMVHLARLANGEVVAVKIRRPGLDRVVKQDLEALRKLAGWLDYFPPMRRVPVRETVDEFGHIIARQLDFIAEADNNCRFRRNFSSQTNIRIPRLREEFCTDSVLTMEYLEGLQSFNDLERSSETAGRVARLTLRALFQMIFKDGFIHADMHPGNVFLLGTESLALLDTGLTVELSPADQRNFASFFFGMVCNKGTECARILFETATSCVHTFCREEFDAEVSALVNRHFAKRASEFEVTLFAAQLFNVMRKHGLRGSTKFMTTILSLVVFEGIAKQIDPSLDFQAEARQYIPVVLRALLPPAYGDVTPKAVKQSGRRNYAASGL